MRRSSALLLLSAFVVLASIPATAEPMDPMEARISLGRDPEPPFCVENPGGSVEISWSIQYVTTPARVHYKLEDPLRTTILDEETYPGSTGVAVTRSWMVPQGMVDGKYWVRVEFWSLEAGNEANAEITFYVCNGRGSICCEKWEDVDCDEKLATTDEPLADWWVCLDSPYGETYCLHTGVDGSACWDGIAPGDYRLWETLTEGWRAIRPDSYDLTLDAGQSIAEIFFNTQCLAPSACCLPDGRCEVLPVGACDDQGGIIYPDAACDPNPCPSACCLPLDETCFMLSERECLAAGGISQDGLCIWAGGKVVCPILRVCCVAEACHIATEADCAALDGVWHPESEMCTPNPCAMPVGATPDRWGAIKWLYR